MADLLLTSWVCPKWGWHLRKGKKEGKANMHVTQILKTIYPPLSLGSTCSKKTLTSWHTDREHLCVSWSFWYWDVRKRSFGFPWVAEGGLCGSGLPPHTPSRFMSHQELEDQMKTSDSLFNSSSTSLKNCRGARR